MTPRISEPVHSEDHKGHGSDGARRDTHPAFGVAVVTRSSGSGRPLFQSDVMHRETINLRIYRAERDRDLAHDWTHQTDELVAVEFSLAQFGALVSSVGIGSGVPCTIRSTENEYMVADLPYEPRLSESIAEVKASARHLADKATATLTALQEAVSSGKIGQIKVALRAHELSIQHIEANAEFHAKSMVDAAEKIVSQAKSDIEAHILGAQRIVGGQVSIEVPDIHVLGIISGKVRS